MISHDLELIFKKAASFFLIFTADITQILVGFSRSLLLVCSPAEISVLTRSEYYTKISVSTSYVKRSRYVAIIY